MVLICVNIYSCIAPLMVPFALVYFCMLFYMYKYQLLYVYVTKHQAGGIMWAQVFDYSMKTLILGSLTLVCYMAIRRSYLSGPFYCLLPLPVLIYLYQHKVEKTLRGPAATMTLANAVNIDAQYVNMGIWEFRGYVVC